MRVFFKNHWIFFSCILLLFLLLFKNPFSGQNIISDLEPSPDSIYYLTPVKSFLEGRGFKMVYEDNQSNTAVPPLYSITLIPLYKIFSDPRSFYFANVIFVFFSTLFFYKVITKLFTSTLIKGVLLFTFVTSPVVYWWPSVAMAENLLICLYILSVWLLLQPRSFRNACLLGLLTVSFYATKYMAWTLSASLILVFSLSAITTNITNLKKSKMLLAYISSVLIAFLGFVYIENLSRGGSIVGQIIFYLKNLANVGRAASAPLTSVTGSQLNAIQKPIPMFSKIYVQDNFYRYFAALLGGPISVAGRDFIIIPAIVGTFSTAAMFINSIFSKFRPMSFYLLVSILSTFSFALMFAATDGRYLFAIVPAIILVFGIFLDRALYFLTLKKRIVYFYLIFLVSAIAIIVSVCKPVEAQLRLNFIGGGGSTNLEAVSTLNEYFKKDGLSKKPLVIFVLSPYQVDFYSNKEYNLLPLSWLQPSADNPSLWDITEKTDFSTVYRKYLSEGREVFVSNYRVLSVYYYSWNFEAIKKQFSLSKVASGCNGRCDIFKLGQYK